MKASLVGRIHSLSIDMKAFRPVGPISIPNQDISSQDGIVRQMGVTHFLLCSIHPC